MIDWRKRTSLLSKNTIHDLSNEEIKELGEIVNKKRKAAQSLIHSRIPTLKDWDKNFDGVHCAVEFKRLKKENWRCPGCGRSLFELTRWTFIRGPTQRLKYADEDGMAWSIGLDRHHDHSNPPRFEWSTICCECNRVDADFKNWCQRHNIPLKRNWSFSPQEIRRIVCGAEPHSSKLDIDYDRALRIYRLVQKEKA